MYENTCWWKYVQNFNSLSCKTTEFCRYECPKWPLFTLFTRIPAFFLFSIFVRLSRSKKCSRVILAFLTKIRTKNMDSTTQTQNLKLTFMTLWHWMTFIWHKVTKDLRVRWVLIGIPDTIHVVARLYYFNLIRLLCLEKLAKTENQTFYIWPDLWRYQWRRQ